MKVFKTLCTWILCLFSIGGVFAQNNVGVGTTSPSEKLEVSGVIYTNTGGIRFPDETLQQTAAFSNFDPEDGGTPNGRAYMLIETSNPPIPDTMWLVDVSQGGVISPGSPDAQEFKMIKEIGPTSHLLFRKLVNNTPLTKVHIHFLTSDNVVYESIEMRNAQLDRINFRDVYIGNGEYAHLEDLEFSYVRLEVKYNQDNADCYCWDFAIQSTCTCD